ncbi:MAG TPA: hypothetical protein VGK53_06210 [Propionicimonas sp.]
MMVVAVLLDPFAESVEECRYGVAVPFLEGVAVAGLADHASLVGEDADVVEEVGVEVPAGWDGAGAGVPDVFVVEPGDDGFVPLPDVPAEVDIGACGDVPGSGKLIRFAEALLLGVGALLG